MAAMNSFFWFFFLLFFIISEEEEIKKWLSGLLMSSDLNQAWCAGMDRWAKCGDLQSIYMSWFFESDYVRSLQDSILVFVQNLDGWQNNSGSSYQVMLELTGLVNGARTDKFGLDVMSQIASSFTLKVLDIHSIALM